MPDFSRANDGNLSGSWIPCLNDLTPIMFFFVLTELLYSMRDMFISSRSLPLAEAKLLSFVRFLSLAALGSSFSPKTPPLYFVAKKKGY